MNDLQILVWDEWNRDHIARHEVTPAEAEEVFHSDPVLHKISYKDRLVFVGETSAKRMLTIIIGPVPNQDEGTYYLFSARPAHRSERRNYQNAKGGIQL